MLIHTLKIAAPIVHKDGEGNKEIELKTIKVTFTDFVIKKYKCGIS